MSLSRSTISNIVSALILGGVAILAAGNAPEEDTSPAHRWLRQAEHHGATIKDAEIRCRIYVVLANTWAATGDADAYRAALAKAEQAAKELDGTGNWGGMALLGTVEGAGIVLDAEWREGGLAAAENLVRSLEPHPVNARWATRVVARKLIAEQRYDEAERVLGWTPPLRQEQLNAAEGVVLSRVAPLVEQGDYAAARKLITEKSRPEMRLYVERLVCSQAGQAGHYVEALRFAKQIDDEKARQLAMQSTFALPIPATSIDRAVAALPEAEDAALRDLVATKIAAAMFAAGRPDDAAKIVVQIADAAQRESLLYRELVYWAEQHQFDKANALLGKIQPNAAPYARYAIAKAMVAAGQLDQAESMIGNMSREMAIQLDMLIARASDQRDVVDRLLADAMRRANDGETHGDPIWVETHQAVVWWLTVRGRDEDIDRMIDPGNRMHQAHRKSFQQGRMAALVQLKRYDQAVALASTVESKRNSRGWLSLIAAKMIQQDQGDELQRWVDSAEDPISAAEFCLGAAQALVDPDAVPAGLYFSSLRDLNDRPSKTKRPRVLWHP